MIAGLLSVTACSSSESTDPTTTPSSTLALPTVEECEEMIRAAVQPLQDFIDRYDELTPEEWNALDPPPGVDPVQEEVVALAQAAVDLGCDVTATEALLAESIEQLSGTSEVGRAVAAALRGEGPLLGPPRPIPTTTIAPYQVPATVTLEAGESLPALMERLAPGSTVRFGPGVHRFVEPILVDMDLTFVGAGREDTIISSSAEGAALSFVGPGGFELRDLTVEHTGDAEASVFLAIEGPVTIDDVRIRGGASSSDGSGGGHGIVFAYEDLPGFPERTESERAGQLLIRNSAIIDNDGAGVLISGSAAPDISDVEVTRNGGCGLCYTGTDGGSVTASAIVANGTGVQIVGAATPSISGATIALNGDVGVTIGDDADVTIESSTIDDNGDIGVQVIGSGRAIVESSSISDHGVGVLAAESAQPIVRDNDIEGHQVGVQLGDDVDAEVTGNRIVDSAVSGVSLASAVTGAISSNVITDAPEVAIQAAGSSTAEIRANDIAGPGLVGVSLLGSAAVTVADNIIREREVGIQVGDSADPDVVGNEVTASVSAGILVGAEALGLISSNTLSGSEGVGLLVGGTADPRVENNRMFENGVGLVFREQARGTAFDNDIERHAIGIQIVEEASSTLLNNTVVDSVEAGVVFSGTTTAFFELNTVAKNGSIAIQIGESANPTILRNEIRGPGVYGVLLRDTASGTLEDNLIADHVFGVQVGDSAAPALLANRLEDIALTSIAFADTSGGRAVGNTCAATLSGGISVAPTANPEIGDNDCSSGGVSPT